MSNWPKQRDCDVFYGNPRGKNGGPSAAWEADNLVMIAAAELPFVIRYAGKPVSGIRCHRKVRDAFLRVLKRIWEASGRSQAKIDEWAMSDFNGCYVYRQKRAGSSLSMHAYGCAFDFDADRNGFKDTTPNFANIPAVLDAWKAEGAVWGGPWRPNADGMHWQFAVPG
jgi:hypothetical protein